MARIQRKRRGRRLELPEVSLTPLIDTALTLLVIFMITAPMVQNGIHITLPQGDSKEVGKQQEMVVTYNKDEKLFFNSYPISRKSLIETIKNATGGKDDIPVFVRADESLSYGKVIGIVDELKEAGVRYVAMSTRAIGS